MRPALVILLCFFPWLQLVEAQGDQEEGEVQIEPSEGEIQPGATIRFTFPTAMVAADRLDVANQPLPFQSDSKENFCGKARPKGRSPYARLLPEPAII